MTGIDKRRERRFRGVVPLPSRGFTASVLGRGDNLEVRAFELVVQFLPTWQIESAPSPGCPGNEQYFLAAELRQANETARSVGDGNLRSDARFEKGTAYDGHLAKTPHARAWVRNHTLTGSPRESGQMELVATQHRGWNRNTNVGAAGALGFQLEFVDPREIGLVNPERFGDVSGSRTAGLYVDGAAVVQDRDAGRCLSLTQARGQQRCRANCLQEVSSLHGRLS